MIAQISSYPSAANTLPVGNLMGDMVNFLVNQNGSLTRFHFIGFSLGAHVVGNAGARVFELTNRKVPRVTGLDPAQPGFTLDQINTRLDKTDATFVDIIHSNSLVVIDGSMIGIIQNLFMVCYLSFPNPIGHVDFW